LKEKKLTQTTLSNYFELSSEKMEEVFTESGESKVLYRVSTYPSKFGGYHCKNKINGTVTLFVSTIWKTTKNNINMLEEGDDSIDLFNWFVDDFIYLHILERICLERGFQKIKMKNRCKPSCKMSPYAGYIFQAIKKNEREEVK
jgi:hypothetical protein